jgi:hypothetical protein
MRASSGLRDTPRTTGRDGRVAEGAPLLREYRVKKLYRGFESLSLRQRTSSFTRARSSVG